MTASDSHFDEAEALHRLAHFLPAQAPLKDFIHHNTLHAFQDLPFHQALLEAHERFGYKTYLSLTEFRQRFHDKTISPLVLQTVIQRYKGVDEVGVWLQKMLHDTYDLSTQARIGSLRAYWKKMYQFNLDKQVHTSLFRVLCSYLDQGVSMWPFPVHEAGFLASVRALDAHTFDPFFKSARAKALLADPELTLHQLLQIVVGHEAYFEAYMFDQQFRHPGWSGMVATLEHQPQALLDPRPIALRDVVMFELLLEIDALDQQFGELWAPLCHRITEPIPHLFDPIPHKELFEVLRLWQEAFEWTLYDQVLCGLHDAPQNHRPDKAPSFQAMFCMDDRECSLRRHMEALDPNCETFGTPGFFNVAFYFQPLGGKFYTKLCPAPLTPIHLIKEIGEGRKRDTDLHFHKSSHSLLPGWLISQTLGFWAALRLFVNIFKPTMTPATSASFRHLDAEAQLAIDFDPNHPTENGLQLGFTPTEMADRVEGLLRSIGLLHDFAPLVYLVSHGATSVNNTHYAGYDCGACSGRPGSVNAKIMAYMANAPQVRQLLAQRGIHIPETTHFVAALHDTTRDDVVFYDLATLSVSQSEAHARIAQHFVTALDFNAKERSRRFDTVDSHDHPAHIHDKIRRRSVSLFEPRPELNHATNALCIVGRRALSKSLFLDRRSFMNSYDCTTDPDGTYLYGILKAVAPVGGGINLEYYFSKVDNYRLGAGTKLPHNVMGLLGVANGIDGDLRPGLPSQMIEMHDPVRLLVVVEHYPEVALATIQKDPATYEWFKNEWVRLAVVHPDTHQLYRFEKEQFEPYTPLTDHLDTLPSSWEWAEEHPENLPITFRSIAL